MTKNAVIVGATGNLGQAVSKVFQEAGYNLDQQWLFSNRPDVTLAESYDSLPDKIDAAIYIAGVNPVSLAENLSEENWDLAHNVNLKGAYLFAKSAFPALKKSGRSSFIVISSIMVTHPYKERLAYATAKAGLEAMARVLAVEWGEYGISTQAIRLGHLAGLMKSTQTAPKLLTAVKQHMPQGKLIEPSEVAKYILWLADGGCASVTGNVTDFDPAYTINRWPVTE